MQTVIFLLTCAIVFFEGKLQFQKSFKYTYFFFGD